MKIRIGHSPDSDDAFMFHAIANGKISTGNYQIEHVIEDIESLNQRAMNNELEVTAVSIHAYAYISDRYRLMSCGASMGEGYGPMVVAPKDTKRDRLARLTIAIPGIKTSAFLALTLMLGKFNYIVIPFDQILDAVVSGDVDAGLIIHEGQLTYKQFGLKCLVDLGQWWLSQAGLPLPLGANVIKSELGDKKSREICSILCSSIEYALNNREEALDYALSFARGLSRDVARNFINMYVNRRTVEYGIDGRKGVQLFLDQAFSNKLIPKSVTAEYLGTSYLYCKHPPVGSIFRHISL